jgi:hypothetical protein
MEPLSLDPSPKGGGGESCSTKVIPLPLGGRVPEGRERGYITKSPIEYLIL